MIERAREATCFDPRPEWCSPLTPGVQLVNLNCTEDGRTLWVDLGEDWARMLAQLSLPGRGLVMTRNEAAILGRRMKYPLLNVTSGGGKAASGDEGLWVDFRHLGAARAVHLRRETGHVFGVEFANRAGQIVHRFSLTPESDMDEFFAWLRLHQACAAHQPATWLEDEEEAAPPEPSHALRRCDSGALLSIVAACVNEGVPLRATVCGAAVMQRAEFIPRSLQQAEEWWFASDDTTGLHFHPDLFAQVTLEQKSQGHGGTRVALRATIQEDATALILEAAGHAAEDAWRVLLEATV